MKKKEKSLEGVTTDLITKSLKIATLHLEQLEKKAKDSNISSQDSFALCSYLKTFSYIERNTSNNRKDMKKAVSSYTDEELNAILNNYVDANKHISGEQENDSEDET
jgi:hypothetical protein